MQAFVGLAHMEGKYSPEEIAKLAGHFAYLSTTTPVSVEQIERAASYAIPMLRTADFDPEQLLLMITSMQRAGIQNTKSGTWISQLATQSFPGTSLMSRMLFEKHEDALRDLGLIDEHEKPTWFTDGRPDLVKMTAIAGDAIERMDPAHRLAIEKALWGQQGGRAAGFFADPTNRAIMGAVAGEEKDFISGEQMWRQTLENSPIVQFRTAFAGLNVELMNLGSNVLPFVTNALKKANETLGGKGELALIGAGVMGWFNRGSIWKAIKGIGGGVLGAVNLPWAIDQMTGGLDDIPNGHAPTNPYWPFPPPGSRPGPLPADVNALVDADYKRRNANDVWDSPEARRGRAMNSLDQHGPTQTTLNLTTNLKVDGRTIASIVEKYIVNGGRVVNASSGHDGQEHAPSPDLHSGYE